MKGDVHMKATGIVRKIDELGRIVLPIELRRTLTIDNGDPVEIFVDDELVVLRKYHPACIFCNSADEITIYKGKNVCRECVLEMNK